MRTGRWGWAWMALAGLGMLCLASVPAHASGEVGMEAYGVDPAAVLGNRWGLDVRDGFNRPVSRRLMERDLKAASAKAAAESSLAPGLPHAKAAVLLMELLPRVDARLRMFLPISFSAAAAATSVPKPPEPVVAALCAGPPALSAQVLRPRSDQAVRSSFLAPKVLRC